MVAWPQAIACPKPRRQSDVDILRRAPTFYMGRQHFDVNCYFVYCRQKPTFYQFMILQSVLPVYFAISFA
jgi:hypothetical protein